MGNSYLPEGGHWWVMVQRLDLRMIFLIYFAAKWISPVSVVLGPFESMSKKKIIHKWQLRSESETVLKERRDSGQSDVAPLMQNFNRMYKFTQLEFPHSVMYPHSVHYSTTQILLQRQLKKKIKKQIYSNYPEMALATPSSHVTVRNAS